MGTTPIHIPYFLRVLELACFEKKCVNVSCVYEVQLWTIQLSRQQKNPIISMQPQESIQCANVEISGNVFLPTLSSHYPLPSQSPFIQVLYQFLSPFNMTLLLLQTNMLLYQSLSSVCHQSAVMKPVSLPTIDQLSCVPDIDWPAKHDWSTCFCSVCLSASFPCLSFLLPPPGRPVLMVSTCTK